MKRKLISILILLLMGSPLWGSCGDKVKKRIESSGELVVCEKVNGLTNNKDQNYIISIFNEEKGRGIVLKIFKADSLKGPVFEEGGLGEILGKFAFQNSFHKFIVADLTGDGRKELVFKTMSERTSLLLAYTFDEKKMSFRPIQFSSPLGGKLEVLEMLVGSLDYPIKVFDNWIDMYYEQAKFIRYEYKDGGYHKKK